MKELEFRIKNDYCYIIYGGKVIEKRPLTELEQIFDKYLKIKQDAENN